MDGIEQRCFNLGIGALSAAFFVCYWCAKRPIKCPGLSRSLIRIVCGSCGTFHASIVDIRIKIAVISIRPAWYGIRFIHCRRIRIHNLCPMFNCHPWSRAAFLKIWWYANLVDGRHTPRSSTAVSGSAPNIYWTTRWNKIHDTLHILYFNACFCVCLLLISLHHNKTFCLFI